MDLPSSPFPLAATCNVTLRATVLQFVGRAEHAAGVEEKYAITTAAAWLAGEKALNWLKCVCVCVAVQQRGRYVVMAECWYKRAACIGQRSWMFNLRTCVTYTIYMQRPQLLSALCPCCAGRVGCKQRCGELPHPRRSIAPQWLGRDGS